MTFKTVVGSSLVSAHQLRRHSGGKRACPWGFLKLEKCKAIKTMLLSVKVSLVSAEVWQVACDAMAIFYRQ